ncbi:MAG: hypothetical protein SangKO_008710 [Sandaracinaceae bacterium]
MGTPTVEGVARPAVAEAAEVTRLVRGLRWIARSAVRTFYSSVEATGLENVDPARPTLYAPTHPNSIIDPLLVALFEERPICFVARDGLFDVPVFGAVLRAVGAIPVARRSDHAGEEVDHGAMFSACREALASGKVLVLFPEGKTHGRLRVERLKTGLARIALDAPPDTQIIPIGLNYLVRHAFRSDVHVAFGEPIAPTGTVAELTERVADTLRRLTVHIEREDDERLIAQVTAMMAEVRAHEGLDREASPADRVALAQRVVDAYRWLGERDPERTATLRARIQALLEERAELGLGGERPALQHRGERRIARRWADDPVTFVLGAPVALYGIVNNALPYLALRVLLGIAPPSFYRGALVRLGGGLAIFALAYAAQTAVVATYAPALAPLYALSLVPSAFFARRYLAELRLHRVGPRRLFRMVKHRGRLAYLRAERDDLAAELAELRREYLAR